MRVTALAQHPPRAHESANGIRNDIRYGGNAAVTKHLCEFADRRQSNGGSDGKRKRMSSACSGYVSNKNPIWKVKQRVRGHVEQVRVLGKRNPLDVLPMCGCPEACPRNDDKGYHAYADGHSDAGPFPTFTLRHGIDSLPFESPIACLAGIVRCSTSHLNWSNQAFSNAETLVEQSQAAQRQFEVAWAMFLTQLEEAEATARAVVNARTAQRVAIGKLADLTTRFALNVAIPTMSVLPRVETNFDGLIGLLIRDVGYSQVVDDTVERELKAAKEKLLNRTMAVNG